MTIKIPLFSSLVFLAGIIQGHSEVIYTSSVEEPDNTWSFIFNSNNAEYTSGNDDLAPTAGDQYFFSTTTKAQQRGFYDTQLDSLTVQAGTYTVTFDIGTQNNFKFADKSPPLLGLTGNLSAASEVKDGADANGDTGVNGDNGASLLDTKDPTNVSVVAFTSPPLDEAGWETWTLTYTVDSNASVIGQDLGFWAKFYSGDESEVPEGYAFDNFSVSFEPEP